LEKNNIVQLPQLSKIDKQFIALEKQQQLIQEQSKLIAESKDV